GRALAKADPGNAVWKRDTGVGWNKIGDVQAASGDLTSALQSYEQALAIARDYAKSVPGNLEGRRDLTVTLDKIGDTKWKAGDTTGSLDAYEESLDISRELAAADRNNVTWQTDLVVRLYKLAELSDGDKRKEAVQEALTIVDRLEAEGKLSPDKKNWKDLLLALRAPSSPQPAAQQ
ncbi:MAG TPA: tetratricopeptide repeat protein, partial [Methyloceanibacter sp.]